VIGRAFQSPAGAISHSGNRVAQQFTFFVHTGTIAQPTRSDAACLPIQETIAPIQAQTRPLVVNWKF
jgi:hypothetical protein